jgi:hypothetical protein
MTCPRCSGIAESDSVDIGVGIQVRGNFYCPACEWCAEEPTDAELGLDDMGDELFAAAREHSSPRQVPGDKSRAAQNLQPQKANPHD